MRRRSHTVPLALAAYIALAFLTLSGCGDDDTARCLVLSPTGLEPVRGAEFGTLEPDFTPYPEGGTAPIVMGLQGGFMVVPTIRIQAEPGDPDELCVTLRLTNTLDESGVPLPSLERVFTLQRIDDVYDTPRLENFLSFLRTDLIGRPLTMEVEVTTEGFVARDTTTFELGPPEP